MTDIDILGIDLGTTNSAIAIWDLEAEQPRVLKNREGKFLTPSVVMFDPDTEAPLVGQAAIERMVEQPSHVAYSVKRFMGRTFKDEQVSRDKANVTYAIEETEQQKVVVRLGNRLVTPPQISAQVLRKLKEDAEALLNGRKITKAVITVPAYFNESQRQATKEAGEFAGLQVPRIINEPTAAALAFGLGAEPQTIAVYDLGGGTFDVSIIRIEDGVFDVESTNGDPQLGGDDFDSAIVDWIITALGSQHSAEFLKSNTRLFALLREEAKKAKIALTDSLEYTLEYAVTLSGLSTTDNRQIDCQLTLTRSHLEELVQPLIKHTLTICDRALEEAKLTASDIDQVLLVGGQTRMPAIKVAIREHFNCNVNDSINPDEAVARGASILGARLCGHLKDKVKLWDVIPLSLGLELSSGRMEIIVPANQQVPCKSQPKYFTTQQDGQETIRFCIYQGERPIAKDNLFIGEVILDLKPPRPAGEHRIKCVFSVDQDGILHVLAEDTNTDEQPIEKKFDRVYRVTQQEVEAMLKKAKASQEEDAITEKLLQLKEELQQLKQQWTKDKFSETAVAEQMEMFEIAVGDRDGEKAKSLLSIIKEKLQS